MSLSITRGRAHHQSHRSGSRQALGLQNHHAGSLSSSSSFENTTITFAMIYYYLCLLLISASASHAFLSAEPQRRAPTLSVWKESTEIDALGRLNLQSRDAKKSRIPLHSATQDQATTSPEVWTTKELEQHARQEGVQLTISTLGPGFRTVARSTSNSSAILGYGEGFVRPSGDILHLDKMEVFKKMVDKVREENPEFRGGGSTFGVGLLFGYQCLLHGLENGCTVAEFLAIDDEEFQHKRLVRFYSRSGFEIVKYIGDDFQDVPARMVWGGCGTLMRAKIDDLLPLWTQILQKSAKKQ